MLSYPRTFRQSSFFSHQLLLKPKFNYRGEARKLCTNCNWRVGYFLCFAETVFLPLYKTVIFLENMSNREENAISSVSITGWVIPKDLSHLQEPGNRVHGYFQWDQLRRSCCDTRFAFSVLHMQFKFLYIIYEVYASSFQFTFIV